MTNSRDKGQRGERDVFKGLSKLLGFEVRRNAAPAARSGEPDSHELPYFAPEVKRTEEWREDYWRQAVEQARAKGLLPVLFWRRSRESWSVFVDGGLISTIFHGERVRLTLEQFAKLWQAINVARAQ